MARKKKNYRFLFFIFGMIAGLAVSTYFALHVAKKFDPHFTLRKERIEEAVQSMMHPNAPHVDHSLAFDQRNAFMRQSHAMAYGHAAAKPVAVHHVRHKHHLKLARRHKRHHKLAVSKN